MDQPLKTSMYDSCFLYFLKNSILYVPIRVQIQFISVIVIRTSGKLGAHKVSDGAADFSF